MKKIWIIGAGASGKDHLRKRFENKGYSFGINYTTRPKRDNETHGIDYYFISEKNFKFLINNNKLIEYTIHNNWYYGLGYEEFETKDVFIISLKSYLKYSDEIRNKVFKIFIDIDKEIRKERLSKRNDADTIERRLIVDEEDLNLINKTEFDLIINNEKF